MLSLKKVKIESIGYVETDANEMEIKVKDKISKIILREDLTEALEGVKDFSHLFVIFWMHGISTEERKLTKVHPRGRSDMPLLGVFATRSPDRPNPIGLTLVELLKIEKNILTVRGLDALNGTPILDLKPFDSWDVAKNANVPDWWRKLEIEHRGSAA
jgi:tRNA-Thr(GGU) m(6)t(6)A37 methyltransferase TsaA